ncbi:MAG TPA: alpha/beta hydrolase [Ktedonobacteraceae bacterium]|nr:alpha/beta hydrolase [Ktedonobacteraceae bacterium]
MNRMQTNTLRVPGATISYEVRGQGPLLLLIPGGGNDAHQAFEGIARRLSDRYSVVIYDRRGLSRSPLDDPQEEQRVGTHSDDASRLLAALGSDYEPAYVFGSSGGAIVGLDLVARHPEQVHTVIAHEPPTHLLPDRDPVRAMGVVRDTYFREGIMAALQRLMAMPGLNPEGHETDIESPEPEDEEQREQFVKNAIFLFEREFSMYDRYQLDFAALKSATTRSRIVIAGGASNRDDEAYWSAVAVAEGLGSKLVEFPGRHAGYVTNPAAFVRRLHEVLDAAPRS